MRGLKSSRCDPDGVPAQPEAEVDRSPASKRLSRDISGIIDSMHTKQHHCFPRPANQNRMMVLEELEDTIDEDETEDIRNGIQVQMQQEEAPGNVPRTTTTKTNKVIVATMEEKVATTLGPVMFTFPKPKLFLNRTEQGVNSHLIPPYNLRTRRGSTIAQ